MIKVITVIVETVRKLGLNYEAQPLDTFSSLERMAETLGLNDARTHALNARQDTNTKNEDSGGLRLVEYQRPTKYSSQTHRFE